MNQIDTLADRMRQLTKEKEPELIEKKWNDLIKEIETVASIGQNTLYTDTLSLLPKQTIFKIRGRLTQEGFIVATATGNPSLLIISWE